MTQINPKEVIERGIIGNLADVEEQIQSNGVDLTIKNDIIIPSCGFINIELNEHFDMQDTFGLIRIRSSFSRKGIFLSSGIFDSNFRGAGGISLYNLSAKPFEAKKGMRVCQMIVFKGDVAKPYDGFYNKSKSIKSKLDVE